MGKMNLEVKTNWIEALNSGEYEQGKGALCRGGKFCCLGVLTDLAVKDGQRIEVRERENRSVRYNESTQSLPPVVQGWAGVNVSLPRVTVGLALEVMDEAEKESGEALKDARAFLGRCSDTVGLDALNDYGLPFKFIAELIDRAL